MNEQNPAIPELFLSPYNPQDHEDKIYKLWEESGFFNPDNHPGERSEQFSIVMPPPNANGSLHAGHALFVTMQDIMMRYERMKGKKVFGLPNIKCFLLAGCIRLIFYPMKSTIRVRIESEPFGWTARTLF